MSDDKPRRPSLALETLIVEVPQFTEAELRSLGQRCDEVMAATLALQAETLEAIRRINATISRFGGQAAPRGQERPPLRVVEDDPPPGERPAPRPRRKR